jgi:hypothetical protein
MTSRRYEETTSQRDWLRGAPGLLIYSVSSMEETSLRMRQEALIRRVAKLSCDGFPMEEREWRMSAWRMDLGLPRLPNHRISRSQG